MNMSVEEAKEIMFPLFNAYYGPGYTWRHLIDDMLFCCPKGEENTKGFSVEKKKEYMAAYILKREMSRTKHYITDAR